MPADEFKAPDDTPNDTPDDTPDDDTPDSPEDDGVEGDDEGDDDEDGDEDDDGDDDEYGVTDSIGTGDADGQEKPAVFVTTREPIALTVSRLDDPRAPESSALAAYIDGRMVARSAMPPEAIERLVDLKLFEEPVAIGLFAYEDAPGLQCRLFALVPRAALEADAHASEPWKASVPSYEAMRDAEDDMDDDMDDEGRGARTSCTECAARSRGSVRWETAEWLLSAQWASGVCCTHVDRRPGPRANPPAGRAKSPDTKRADTRRRAGHDPRPRDF